MTLQAFLYTPMNHCSPFSTQLYVHVVTFTNCCCSGAVQQVTHAHRVMSRLTNKPEVMLKSPDVARMSAHTVPVILPHQ